MRFVYRLICFLLFFSDSILVLAQTVPLPAQVVRGRVLDAETDRPLSQATITLEDAQQSHPTATDANGVFRYPKISVGRYQLRVQSLGYESQTVAELVVESGKEQVIDVRLRPGTEQLAETVVKGIRPDNNLTSTQSITPEQVLRFPATYLDPARLATSFAGVVNTNDQANNLAVRGNSPNGLTWRLADVEIVNPNHLSNAGTIGDRPTSSGGGVNILSAQLLGPTRFLTGAFGPQYGNTLAGVMDMSLRTGNNERRELTAQVGLIGVDLAAEGPINRQRGSSYLVNYRYSFTGLLGLLGITFGGEAIQFQDLAVNLNFPTRRGSLTLFGVAGASRNDFTAKADSLREEDKDRFNIGFTSRMGAGGLTYTQNLGSRWTWKLSAVASMNTNTRTQSPATLPLLASPFGFGPYQRDHNTNGRATLLNQFSYRVNDRSRWQTGLYLTRWYGSMRVDRDYRPINLPDGNSRIQEGVLWAWLVQPFVNFQYRPRPTITLNAGLHGNFFTLNKNSASLEPRLSGRWQTAERDAFTLAYGLHSQTQQPVLYISRETNFFSSRAVRNEGLGLTKAHHLVAGYTHEFSETASLKAEAYYQALFDVPVSDLPGSVFSAINLLDTETFAVTPEPLINAGRGRNMGLELTYQKLLAKNYYLLLTGSVYDSKFSAQDGIWRDSRFNGRHAINFTGGKEITSIRRGNTHTWGFNAKLTQAGGFRDRPIDEAASRVAGTTVYAGNEYSVQLADYVRADVRIYWKKSRDRSSRTLSLDLLNATNAQNAAFSTFDALLGRVVPRYQLGLLPLLNYRWEF
jgi:hypothetical protein